MTAAADRAGGMLQRVNAQPLGLGQSHGEQVMLKDAGLVKLVLESSEVSSEQVLALPKGIDFAAKSIHRSPQGAHAGETTGQSSCERHQAAKPTARLCSSLLGAISGLTEVSQRTKGAQGLRSNHSWIRARWLLMADRPE